MNEAKAYDQSPPEEDQSELGEEVKEVDRPPCHNGNSNDVEENLEVSEEIFPTVEYQEDK